MTESFIPMAMPVLRGRELEYVTEAVQTGWISSAGKFVTAFEETFAAYCGARYGVATSSGTAALHLALAALHVEAGDEVILPTLTMIATANAVTYTGARPVLVDSEPKTWNIDVGKIEAKLTPQTRVLMPVHTYGHPADMDGLRALADKYGLALVTDAAEAHGSEYNGSRQAILGDIACFSFYANKIITTGEGGMIVTDNDELAERARKLRDQAFEKDRRFWHRELGFNYRMTNIQAAIGLAQTEHIDEFVEIHRENARRYTQLLCGVPGLTLPSEAYWAKNVYWMYSVLVDQEFGCTRDELIDALREQGIDARTFFYPIHQQPLYSAKYEGQTFPVADSLARRGLNLPSGNELTGDHIGRIAASVKAIHKQARGTTPIAG